MTDGKQNRMSAASARGGRRVGMLSEEIAVGSGVMLCTSVNMRHMGFFSKTVYYVNQASQTQISIADRQVT